MESASPRNGPVKMLSIKRRQGNIHEKNGIQWKHKSRSGVRKSERSTNRGQNKVVTIEDRTSTLITKNLYFYFKTGKSEKKNQPSKIITNEFPPSSQHDVTLFFR